MRPTGGAEDGGGEEVHDGFGKQNGVVPRNTGVHGAKPARAAETKEHDHADDIFPLLIREAAAGKPAGQSGDAAADGTLQLGGLTGQSAQDQGQDDR